MAKNFSFTKSLWFKLFLLSIFFHLFFPGTGKTCTLWGAAGDSVAGGGTILAKNRDWVPNHQQRISLIHPKDGYRYIGIDAFGNDNPGLKGGVNEEGLVVVTASPPPYLEREKKNYPRKNIIHSLLKGCRNVREALRQEKSFAGPRFIMMSDVREIAYVEIGLEGKFIIRSTPSGVLSHTNHYVETELMALNPEKPYVSSQERLKQIRHFLNAQKEFDLKDFIKISRSEENGPDNSIWRTGSKATSSRTLATWIVYQPIDGDAILFLRMANLGKGVKEYQYSLKDLFAGKVDLKNIE